MANKAIGHMRPQVIVLRQSGKTIGPERYLEVCKDLGGLTAREVEHLVPVMSVELLIKSTKQSMDNCERLRPGTFSSPEETVVHLYTPELLRRLEAKVG